MSRELDEQCAKALGYDTLWADGGFGETLYLHDTGAVRESPNVTSNCRLLGASWERLRIDGEIVERFVRYCPAFSERLEDAKILEDEIERRGLQRRYMDALADTVDAMPFDDVIYPWSLFHATPKQRARAFLKAIES